MPVIGGDAPISSVLGQAREGVSRHSFVGANAHMLRILNKYRGELGVVASAQELDAAASRTFEFLRTRSAELAIEVAQSRHESSIDRCDRAQPHWTQVSDGLSHRDGPGCTLRYAMPAGGHLFESGAPQSDGSIAGNDNDSDRAQSEPHYGRIERDDRVQIYESVMIDEGDRVTTGLLRGVRYVKDNRLLPRGSTKRLRPKFAVQGEAQRILTFGGWRPLTLCPAIAARIASVKVTAKLWFQSIGYRWAYNLSSTTRRKRSVLSDITRRHRPLRPFSSHRRLRRFGQLDNLVAEEHAREVQIDGHRCVRRGGVFCRSVRHGSCDLRLRAAGDVAAASEARGAVEVEGLADPAHQDRWRLLRGLRAQRERRAGRGVLPSEDAGAGADQEALMFAGGAPATVPVWDPLVRISHWLLVATVAFAWLTRHGWGAWHEWIGYGALAIIAIRFVWGFVGTTMRVSDSLCRRCVVCILAASGESRRSDAARKKARPPGRVALEHSETILQTRLRPRRDCNRQRHREELIQDAIGCVATGVRSSLERRRASALANRRNRWLRRPPRCTADSGTRSH